MNQNILIGIVRIFLNKMMFLHVDKKPDHKADIQDDDNQPCPVIVGKWKVYIHAEEAGDNGWNRQQ